MESEVCWKVHIETIKARNYDLDMKNPYKAEESKEYTSQEIIELLEHSLAKSHDLMSQLKQELV